MLRELQPGIRLPRPIGDAGDWKDPARAVALRPERVRAVLGVALEDDQIADLLGRLHLPVTRGEPWSVAVPSARATKDLTIEDDLIEEVGRLHGYGNVPEARLASELVPAPWDPRRDLVRRLADRLSGAARFHEALTYSFHERELVERVGIGDEPHVAIVNPQIEGLDRVRRSVVPSLLAHLEKNLRHTGEVRLFEIGKGYLPERANERGEPAEVHELALVWAAPRPGKGARFDAGVASRLQGAVEDLCAAVGHPLGGWERAAAGLPTWAHPGRTIVAAPAGGAPGTVVLASLEPEVRRRLGLTGELDCEVACARISIDALLDAPAAPRPYRPIPRFPDVKVDVAVSVPEERAAGDVAAAIRTAGKGLVGALELFDLYRSEKLGAGRKSLAYHVRLAAADRTLSDQDVARFLGRVERAVAALGGELRRE